MSKVVESLVKDAIERVKTPEFHSAVVAPLLSYILDMLSPYLFAIVGLWGLMFLGIVAILVILIRLIT